ncbi:hypothetical protein [Pseudorhodobacter ferrugineus]|uniref:hypothetical protein n=1 Tax=Pseudorhodobacter ferrugineus TaxID=77008 RepID=UPI0003B50F5E|nr:hypothetical protein [Pseudorhodobacter ferrugineus]
MDASLAEDVFLDLTEAQVIAEVQKSKRSKLIVEEYISGTELRITVVGGKVVGAYIRNPPNVVGDGVHTIAELVDLKNKKFETFIYPKRIHLEQEAEGHLAKSGKKTSDIPRDGEKVTLWHYRNNRHGAEFETATHLLNDSLKQVVISASQAIGLPVTGIDIVISDDENTPGSFILEINERPNFSQHVFPDLGASAGMLPFDSIIDLYFPKSTFNKFNNAMFDYKPVLNTMQSGAMDSVALPVIRDDFQHFRINFRSELVAEAVALKLRRSGAFIIVKPQTAGAEYVLDVLFSPRSLMFLQSDRKIIKELAPELEKVISWPSPDLVKATFTSEARGQWARIDPLSELPLSF